MKKIYIVCIIIYPENYDSFFHKRYVYFFNEMWFKVIDQTGKIWWSFKLFQICNKFQMYALFITYTMYNLWLRHVCWIGYQIIFELLSYKQKVQCTYSDVLWNKNDSL